MLSPVIVNLFKRDMVLDLIAQFLESRKHPTATPRCERLDSDTDVVNCGVGTRNKGEFNSGGADTGFRQAKLGPSSNVTEFVVRRW